MDLPNKKYNIIYADPPWNIKTGPDWNSNGKARDLIYPTMSLEEISNLFGLSINILAILLRLLKTGVLNIQQLLFGAKILMELV
jgi:hypothetical protein